MKQLLKKLLFASVLFVKMSEAAICPPCPVFLSGPISSYCNLNVTQQLCVSGNTQLNGDLTVCGTIINDELGFGNTLRVDQVFGTDTPGRAIRGIRQVAPFATIGAALAASQPGDVIWVFPGVYNESIIIPDNRSVVGLSFKEVIIQKTDVTTATDLVTMGENSSLQNVTLNLTSALHVSLRGGVFPGTTSATSSWNNVYLTVDNSGASGGGNSNVYGVQSTGTGFPAFGFSTLLASSITVNSIGNGVKRGILVNSASGFTINDTNVVMNGGNNSIGAETNNIAASFIATSSNIGGTIADISQTLGSLSITATKLVHSQANGNGFHTASSSGDIIWLDPNPITSGSMLFMGPGTVQSSNTEFFIPIVQPLLVRALAAHAVTPSGGSETTTFTLRKNGVDTVFTVVLVGNQTDNVNASASVHFEPGDTISLQIDTSALAATANVSLLMDLY